jgi:hypothetical protein
LDDVSSIFSVVKLFLYLICKLVFSLIFEELSHSKDLLFGRGPAEVIDSIEEMRLFMLNTKLRLELGVDFDFLECIDQFLKFIKFFKLCGVRENHHSYFIPKEETHEA